MVRFRRRCGRVSSVDVVVVEGVASCEVAACFPVPMFTEAIELCSSLLDCQNASFNNEFFPKKFLLNEFRLFPTITAPILYDEVVEKACLKGIGVRASFRQHCRHTTFASRPAIDRDSPGRRLMTACGRVAAGRRSCHTFR